VLGERASDAVLGQPHLGRSQAEGFPDPVQLLDPDGEPAPVLTLDRDQVVRAQVVLGREFLVALVPPAMARPRPQLLRASSDQVRNLRRLPAMVSSSSHHALSARSS
jgi:hypothetical protein